MANKSSRFPFTYMFPKFNLSMVNPFNLKNNCIHIKNLGILTETYNIQSQGCIIDFSIVYAKLKSRVDKSESFTMILKNVIDIKNKNLPLPISSFSPPIEPLNYNRTTPITIRTYKNKQYLL